MKLHELLKNIKPLQVAGDSEVEITGVTIDSRRIAKGHLFVAMRGTQVDGHKFIGKAVGRVATVFYGEPSKKLKLVGVTGTNGKTTIATLLYNMFRKMGHRCGLLSTVCNYIEDEAIAADHTTPDPIELNALLARMVEAGCEYAFMECSSHAIAQKAFFDGLPKSAFAITNADDKNGMVMVQNCKAQVKTYSIRQMADFRARILECHFEGMYLEIDGQEVGVQFIGKFNVSNLLAVYGAARMLGKDAKDILVTMSTLHSVSGRLDPVRSPEGYTAIVDYAHTPDALANVLNAIHEVLNKKGHVITVCGAGGNRDKGKRPLMAQEAVRQSDKVIITSDNPRFEDPQDIINDMLAGLNAQQRKNVLAITDRKEAIRTACMMAEKGDVILVAGKGHENYQEIKGVKHHFDDKEVLRDIFNNQ